MPTHLHSLIPIPNEQGQWGKEARFISSTLDQYSKIKSLRGMQKTTYTLRATVQIAGGNILDKTSCKRQTLSKPKLKTTGHQIQRILSKCVCSISDSLVPSHPSHGGSTSSVRWTSGDETTFQTLTESWSEANIGQEFSEREDLQELELEYSDISRTE